MSSYDHDLSIWITEVSATGFRVNGRVKLGKNSYNANGFHVETGVNGYGSRGHTASIGTRGGSYDFSDYYSVGTSYDARSFSCHVSADLSWSSSGTNTGNPVYATANTPAAEFNKPYPPKTPASARVSDTQAKVTWGSNYDNASGRHWHKVYVERSTDGGGYSQIAALNWDATNYFDNGVTANHAYAYRLRAANTKYSDYVTAGTVYNTPAAPMSVAASLVSAGTVRVNADVTNVNTATSYAIERSVDGGEWAKVSEVASFPYDDTGAAGMVSYRVQALRGPLASAWAASDQIAAITPPLAPKVALAAAVMPVGGGVGVSWTPNHPDGSAQEAAQVGYTVDGGTEAVLDAEGAAASAVIPDDGTPHSWSVRVRTKGAHEDWGAWSAPALCATAVPPQVVITRPASDDDVMSELPFSIEWQVSPETPDASTTVRVTAGAASYSAQLPAGARSLSIGRDSLFPASGEVMTVALEVVGTSTLRTTAERTCSVEYAAPAVPAAEAVVGGLLSVSVTVRFGGDGWSVVGTGLVSPEYEVEDDAIPISAGAEVVDGAAEIGDTAATESVDVVRVMPDGSQWVVADGMADGESCIDPLPPINTDYSYLVVARAQSGAVSTLTVPMRVESRCWAVNFGPAAQGGRLFELSPSSSVDVSRTGELLRFAGGGLPMFYGDGGVSSKMSLGFKLLSASEVTEVESMFREHAVAWLRDPMGRRLRARVSVGTSMTVRDLHSVSIDAEEVRWMEAANG